MAVKSITIDTEAYNRRKKCKQPGESFSEVIKRVVAPPLDLDAWLRRIARNPFSKEAIRSVESHMANRRRPSKRAR